MQEGKLVVYYGPDSTVMLGERAKPTSPSVRVEQRKRENGYHSYDCNTEIMKLK